MRPTKEMILNDPITECFAVVASEAMRRPFDFKDQELKDVLWSFSKVRSLNLSCYLHLQVDSS